MKSMKPAKLRLNFEEIAETCKAKAEEIADTCKAEAQETSTLTSTLTSLDS
jgi:hypothetical protein